MERKYVDMILKPYEEEGIVYTDFYKRYGMDKAALIVGNSDGLVRAFNDKFISQLVLADAGDLSRLEEFEFLKKLCIVYTRKPKKNVEWDSLYKMALETLLICGEDRYFADKLDVKRFDNLKRLKIGKAQLVCDRPQLNLTSLELDNIGEVVDLNFLTCLPNLEYLTLSGGKINGFDGIQKLKRLRSLTLVEMEVSAAKGLRGASSLINFSIDGIFDENIICELPYLTELEFLRLNGYVKIDDVKWVGNLNKLKTLILGCPVANGDLSLLVGIPYVLLKAEMKNYNFKDKDFSKRIVGDSEYGIPVYRKF